MQRYIYQGILVECYQSPMDKIPSSDEQSLSATTRSSRYQWVIVPLALIALAGFTLPNQAFPVLFPFIREDLSLSRAQLGLISSAIAGGAGTSVFIGGWIVDVVGVRLVMTSLLAILGLLMIAYLLVSSLITLLILTALVGMVIGPGYPAATRTIMDWFPRKIRGLAMSITMTGAPLSGAIAAAVLPVIAITQGWKLGMLAISSFILVIGLIFPVFYRDAAREHYDRPQVNILALLSVFRNHDLLLAALWASMLMGSQVIVSSYVVLFLVDDLGVSVVAAGGYLAAAHTSSIVARILWGAASDFLFRTKRVPVLVLIGLLTSLGLISISLMDAGIPIIFISIILIILGSTVLSWMGVFTTFVGELAGPIRTGMALGAVNTVMVVSVIAMPPLFGLLVDITNSYSIGWAVTALVTFISSVFLMLFGREPSRV